MQRLNALTEPYLEAITRSRPLFAGLCTAGDQSLEDYVKGFRAWRPLAIQGREDHTDEVARQVGALQGEAMGQRVRTRLAESPLVYTANHLCLEGMALTAQSMVAAAMGEDATGIVPVEPTGLIPADNVSFPLGLLIARRREGKMLRLAILDIPARKRGRMTLGLPPFEAKDLARAADQVHSLGLDTREELALRSILSEELADPVVLALASFRDQAAVCTPRLWRAWFGPGIAFPALAYTPLEPTRTALLQKDLETPGSPLQQLLCDPPLRQEILDRLEGVACCWQDRGASKGTAFFWEVREDGRSCAMVARDQALWTREGTKFPFESAPLLDGLRSGRLVPGVFLSFAVGMVRGLVQVGGFNQLDYLAAMQEGLAAAFIARGHASWGAALRTLPPPMLTAGLAGMVATYPDGSSEAAGGLEMRAAGGLSRESWEGLKKMPLRVALALELPGIARTVLGQSGFEAAGLTADPNWVRKVAPGLVHLQKGDGGN